MLINKQSGQIFHPIQGKEYSDGFLRQYREVHQPQTYNNHPYFKLEERVRMKSDSKTAMWLGRRGRRRGWRKS